MLLENNKRPLNESETHYELKQIAKYILWTLGYKYIATEVLVGCDYKFFKENELKTKGGIIDAFGLKEVSNSELVSMGIESKATLSDYKNGFNVVPDYNYIIAPKGIIPKELIPKEIGLIEVDLKNYEITNKEKGVWIDYNYEEHKPIIGDKVTNKVFKIGIYFTKKTKRREVKEEYRKGFCKRMMFCIARSNTIYDLFKHKQIDIDV
jgi:hypothetical protein